MSSENQKKSNFDELKEYYNISTKIGAIKFKIKLGFDFILIAICSKLPFVNIVSILNRSRGVKIGKNVYLGPNVYIDLLYPNLITIRNNVSIGMNTMIFTHGNPTNSIWIKENIYPRYVKPVVIGSGTWIAPGCIILPGVHIGKRCVIGAGSVVTKSFDDYSVIAGNPARLIKKINPNK